MNKDKNLKEALTSIRDQMVEEDLDREKNSDQLSEFNEKRILFSLNQEKKSRRKDTFKKAFTIKSVLALAASLVIIVSVLALSPIIFSGFWGAGFQMLTDNKSEDSEAYPNTPKEEDSLSDEGMDAKENEKQGLEGGSYTYNLNDSPDKKIIYRFYYNLQTLEFDKARDDLMKLVEKTSSYVEEANIKLYDDAKNANFIIRVPRDKSKDFQKSLGQVGTIVTQNIYSEDLTKQYRDLEADKTTQDIKEEKLQGLLKKAESFDEIIKVENELSKVESQKAQIKKHMADIDHDVDYQFFTVELSEVKKVDNPVGQKPSFGDKISQQFQESLSALGRFFENLALFIVRNWILILIILAAGIVIYKKVKKNSNKIW